MDSIEVLSIKLYLEGLKQIEVAQQEILNKVRSGETLGTLDTTELNNLEQGIGKRAKDIVDFLMEKHGGRIYENTIIWNFD